MGKNGKYNECVCTERNHAVLLHRMCSRDTGHCYLAMVWPDVVLVRGATCRCNDVVVHVSVRVI